MYQIPIDEYHYHVNSLSPEELLWGEQTYRRVLERYQKLKNFIDQETQPLNLNESGKLQLCTTITLAFCHAMKVSKAPETEERLLKTVKAWFFSFLPYIVQNLSTVRCSHPIQFEPIALSCRFIINTYQCAIFEFSDSGSVSELTDLEIYSFQEFSNLLRAMSSSVMLLSIGDDVHGVSIYRGVLEIFSKIALAKKFPEEYVLFKTFNFYLQKNKLNNDPLPKEMTDYLKKERLYAKNPEGFLAYGWARDHSGKRVQTMRQLVLTAMKEEKEKTLAFLQLASEFAHEDYVGIEYDYISIRKTMMELYYHLLNILSHENAFDDILPKKAIKKIRHLHSLADPIYSGETPLPHKTI